MLFVWDSVHHLQRWRNTKILLSRMQGKGGLGKARHKIMFAGNVGKVLQPSIRRPNTAQQHVTGVRIRRLNTSGQNIEKSARSATRSLERLPDLKSTVRLNADGKLALRN